MLTYSAGFTIIELLVVMAIAVLIFAFTLDIGSDFYKNQSLVAERDSVINLLWRARTKAVNNVNQSDQGLFIDTTSHTIFEGSSYALRNVSYDEIFPRSGGIIISGPSEIVFSAINGASNTSGTISINSSKGVINISVNNEGGVSW